MRGFWCPSVSALAGLVSPAETGLLVPSHVGGFPMDSWMVGMEWK